MKKSRVTYLQAALLVVACCLAFATSQVAAAATYRGGCGPDDPDFSCSSPFFYLPGDPPPSYVYAELAFEGWNTLGQHFYIDAGFSGPVSQFDETVSCDPIWCSYSWSGHVSEYIGSLVVGFIYSPPPPMEFVGATEGWFSGSAHCLVGDRCWNIRSYYGFSFSGRSNNGSTATGNGLVEGWSDGVFFEAYGISQVDVVTPEPRSLTLLCSGIVGIYGLLRRKLLLGSHLSDSLVVASVFGLAAIWGPRRRESVPEHTEPL
jgi:hypothetical protein